MAIKNENKDYMRVKLVVDEYSNYESNEDYKAELVTDLIYLFRKELNWSYKETMELSDGLFMTLGNFTIERCLAFCINRTSFIDIHEVQYKITNTKTPNLIIAIVENKIEIIFNISENYIQINNY